MQPEAGEQAADVCISVPAKVTSDVPAVPLRTERLDSGAAQVGEAVALLPRLVSLKVQAAQEARHCGGPMRWRAQRTSWGECTRGPGFC